VRDSVKEETLYAFFSNSVDLAHGKHECADERHGTTILCERERKSEWQGKTVAE